MKALLAGLPAYSSDAGLSRYLAEIRKFPLLEADQEHAYAKRWRDHKDREAAYHLVTSHLRLVAKIAMRFRGYNLPIGEVISEGNIGLMQAVKRFDPDKGVRLATYAMWWIKASIQEYVLRSWSIVKFGMAKNQKKLFFNLRRLRSKIAALDDRDLRPDQIKQIATALDVSEQDVILADRRIRGDVSLNAPIGYEAESERQDQLADESDDPETQLVDRQERAQRLKALSLALSELKPRERHVLMARQLADEPCTLEQLAAEYKVSRERIRQVEARALVKLKDLVRRYTQPPQLRSIGA